MIKAVIIDRQKEIQDKISSILSTQEDFEILGRGKDAYDALKLIGSLKPDVVILDNHLEYIEVQEIPPLLKARSPSTDVVILATKASDFQIYKVATNEVSGLLHKDADIDLLPWVLKSISDGGRFISPFFAARVMHLLAITSRSTSGEYLKTQALAPFKTPKEKFPPQKDPAGYLSKSELQILTCVGVGNSSEEIAQALDLAVGTVRNYISSVMRKTGLRSRSQLVRYALEYGLVPFARR